MNESELTKSTPELSIIESPLSELSSINEITDYEVNTENAQPETAKFPAVEKNAKTEESIKLEQNEKMGQTSQSEPNSAVKNVIPSCDSAKEMTSQWESKLSKKPHAEPRQPRESLSRVPSLNEKINKLQESVDSEADKVVENAEISNAPVPKPRGVKNVPTKLERSDSSGSTKNMLGHWETKMSKKTEFESKRRQRESLSAIGSLSDRKNKFTKNFENVDADEVAKESVTPVIAGASLVEKKKALETTIKRSESAKSTRIASLSKDDETSAIKVRNIISNASKAY